MFAREADFNQEIAQAHRSFPVVPVALVKGFIGAESTFNPQAIRQEPQLKDASRGLMQLLYGTARSLGYGGTPDNLFLPAVNVWYGTKLLAQLFGDPRLGGNWNNVISAYNGGIRPELAFGAVATAPVRVVATRNALGEATSWRTVPAGQYANQEYVDRVRRVWQYFTGPGAQQGGADSAVWLLPLLVGIGAAVLALKGA